MLNIAWHSLKMWIVSKLRSSTSLKLNEEQVLIEHKSASRASTAQIVVSGIAVHDRSLRVLSFCLFFICMKIWIKIHITNSWYSKNYVSRMKIESSTVADPRIAL